MKEEVTSGIYRCKEAQDEEESCVYIAELLDEVPFLRILFITRLYVHIFWHPVPIDTCNMWHILHRTTFFSALVSMRNYEQTGILLFN